MIPVFLSAYCTGPEKIDPVGVDRKITRSADDLLDFGKDLFFEIDDASARAADEVVVGRCFGFESVERTAGVYFLYQALFNEDGKVSVDGSETEAREFRLQSVVEPCCGGMAFSRTQDRQ